MLFFQLAEGALAVTWLQGLLSTIPVRGLGRNCHFSAITMEKLILIVIFQLAEGALAVTWLHSLPGHRAPDGREV